MRGMNVKIVHKSIASIIFQSLKCILILNTVVFYVLKLHKTCIPVLS